MNKTKLRRIEIDLTYYRIVKVSVIRETFGYELSIEHGEDQINLHTKVKKYAWRILLNMINNCLQIEVKGENYYILRNKSILIAYEDIDYNKLFKGPKNE